MKSRGVCLVFLLYEFLKFKKSGNLSVNLSGNNMKNSIQTIKLGKYKHFKGGEYQVIGTAKHSETLEVMVIYKPLYELKEGELETWVRPIEMFFDNKEHGGETVPRFTLIEE